MFLGIGETGWQRVLPQQGMSEEVRGNHTNLSRESLKYKEMVKYGKAFVTNTIKLQFIILVFLASGTVSIIQYFIDD